MSAPADALIVGGGPAGAACAALLARASRRVVLLERETRPGGKVCGGFLSVEAVAYLDALGIDPRALGATPIRLLRLSARHPAAAETCLPFPAMGVSRRRLDAAIQDCARRAGATLRMGAAVAALDWQDRLWRARLAGGEEVTARAAFIATGKHGLRGWARPTAGRGLIGFRQSWHLAPSPAAALNGAVELTLFNGGYAGLEPEGDGAANLCLLVTAQRFRALGGNWISLLAAIRREAPLLDARLAGGAPCAARPDAIAALPFGHVQRPPEDAGAPWRLGDQAAVAPSFTGDGMAIALHSAHLAVAAYLRGDAPAAYHRALAAHTAGPVLRGQALARLLLRPGLQPALARGSRAFPSLLRLAATATRLTGARIPAGP